MADWALTRPNVSAWKTMVLTDLADKIALETQNYGTEVRRLPRHVSDAYAVWSGAAYDAASDRVDEDHRQALTVGEEVNDLVAVLRQAGPNLASYRDTLLGKVTAAEASTVIAGEKYAVNDTWVLRVTFTDNITAEERATIQEAVNGHQGVINKAWYELRDAAREANRLIRAAAVQILDAGNALGEALDRSVIVGTEDTHTDPQISAPPEHATVTQNAAWWSGLTDEEKKEVLTRHPEWVGNRDGLPAAARHEANVSIVDSERKRLEDRLAQLNTDIENHPTGGWFTSEDAERDLVKTKIASLNELDKLVMGNPADGRLLLVDTSGERVKAAFAVGDPDTAEHVSVAVPGKDTTVDRSLSGMVNEAKGLRAEAEDALVFKGETDPKVASVAWIGYEPPDAGGGLPWDSKKSLDNWAEGSIGSATEDRMRAGAPKLASFLEGLDTASTTSDPHITALGHSYGSSTTALALQQLQSEGKPVVDDAVFFGSPGLFADDAGDLGLRPGHAFLAEADEDPVADLGSFGGDPSFGNFDNLSTKDGTTFDGEPRRGVTGHSHYPHQGTITAYNFAMVAAGHPEMAVR